MLVSNFASRLAEAIKLRNLNPAEIVRRSELLYNQNKINKPLNKPLLSNYLKGNYEAKQDNVFSLALILNVDEAWLMGCDVPMENNENNSTHHIKLLEYYNKLNILGKSKAIENIKDLTEIPKYVEKKNNIQEAQ